MTITPPITKVLSLSYQGPSRQSEPYQNQAGKPNPTVVPEHWATSFENLLNQLRLSLLLPLPLSTTPAPTMSTPMEALKKRKRKPKTYGLHTFGHPGCPIAPSGAFRDNIRVFLRQCSEPEEYSVDGMPVWTTFLEHENQGFLVPLYTVEESVKHSLTPFCDHCRSTGEFLFTVFFFPWFLWKWVFVWVWFDCFEFLREYELWFDVLELGSVEFVIGRGHFFVIHKYMWFCPL